MGYEYFYGIQADQFIFYRVPKLFFTQERYRCMTTDDKLLYGMLLDRMNLSAKNGWQDQQGRVYIIYPIEEIMTDMGCADNKATKLLDDLEKRYGLIERKRQGLGKPKLNNRPPLLLFSFLYGEDTADLLNAELINADRINLTPELLK